MDTRERQALRWMHIEVNRLQGDIKWLRAIYQVSEERYVEQPDLSQAYREGWQRFGARCNLLVEVLKQSAIDSTAIDMIQEKVSKLVAVAAAGELAVAAQDFSADPAGWVGPLCSAEDTLDGLEEYVRLVSGMM